MNNFSVKGYLTETVPANCHLSNTLLGNFLFNSLLIILLFLSVILHRPAIKHLTYQ